jgi:hypothetical protein
LDKVPNPQNLPLEVIQTVEQGIKSVTIADTKPTSGQQRPVAAPAVETDTTTVSKTSALTIKTESKQAAKVKKIPQVLQCGK